MLKSALARQQLLWELVQARRRRRSEARYISTRERYHAMAPWISPEVLEEDARDLLARRWSGPSRVLTSPAGVRLFVVAGEQEATGSFVEELSRSFDCVVFNYAEFLPARHDAAHGWRDRLAHAMADAFTEGQARGRFDAAVLYVTRWHVEPITLEKIRAAGVPVVVLSGDDKHMFLERPGQPNGQRPIATAADVNLTNSLECMRWYRAEGAVAWYVRWAADPQIFRPLEIPKDIDVSFVGRWYGARRRLIRDLRAAGVEVRCWGPGTEGGIVSRAEMVTIFNRSRINLGYGGVADAERVVCLKTRDFEVPMSGNLYLTQYNPELAEQYRLGEEILCYSSEIDCVELIRQWLKQPERAAELGRAARARSLAEHTWTVRFSQLFTWMGILRIARETH